MADMDADFDDAPTAPRRSTKKEANLEVGGVAVDRLRSIIERVERLEEEKKALSSDIKDIFSEAKSAGFDVKALRKLISLRKMEAQEREELDGILDVYMRALGM